MKFILGLLVLPIFVLSGCTFFENSFVEWNFVNEYVQITIGKQYGAKWIAVGFNNATNTMPGASIFLFNGTELWEFFGRNFSRPQFLGKGTFNFTEGDSFYEHIITFQIPVNGSFFSFKNEDQNLLFAMNTEQVANSPSDFEKHTHAQSKVINFFAPGYECGVTQWRLYGQYNIPLLITYLVVDALVFILCLIFRNKQPLKSRGLVPFIILCVIASTVSVMIAQSILTKQWQSMYGCYLAFFLSRPNEMVSYFIITVHELRYLLIINLNKMKGLFCSKGNISQITLRARILKKIAAPWFTLVMVFAFWVFMEILNLVLLAIFNFNCGSQTLQSLVFPSVAVVGGGILIFGGCELLFDVISNYKLKCNVVKYFTADAYWYRLELFMGFAIGVCILVLITIRTLLPPLLDSIVFTCLFWTLEGLATVFPLTLTIVREVKRKFKKTSENDKEEGQLIETILSTEGSRELFIEFAKQEWSLENIMIWDDIQRFKALVKKKRKNTRNPEEIKSDKLLPLAKDIYNKYLVSGAVYEVNIDRGSCNAVFKQISENAVNEKTFDHVLSVVKTNLSDTFSRFKVSANYIQWMKDFQEKKEVEKKSGIF